MKWVNLQTRGGPINDLETFVYWISIGSGLMRSMFELWPANRTYRTPIPSKSKVLYIRLTYTVRSVRFGGFNPRFGLKDKLIWNFQNEIKLGPLYNFPWESSLWPSGQIILNLVVWSNEKLSFKCIPSALWKNWLIPQLTVYLKSIL